MLYFNNSSVTDYLLPNVGRANQPTGYSKSDVLGHKMVNFQLFSAAECNGPVKAKTNFVLLIKGRFVPR